MEIFYVSRTSHFKTRLQFSWIQKQRALMENHYILPLVKNSFQSQPYLATLRKSQLQNGERKLEMPKQTELLKSLGGTFKFHSAAELYLRFREDHTKFVQTEEEKSQFDCLKTHLDNYLDATWWQEIPLYSKD